MADTNTQGRTDLSSGPAAAGVVAVLLGTGLTFVYGLSVYGLLPVIGQSGSDFPYSPHPVTIYLSAILGSMLLTWGSFAVVEANYTPLTPRHALAAIVPALVSVTLGVWSYTYRLAGTTLHDMEGEPHTATAIQALQRELTTIQFLAVAAVGAMVVGTVTATRDRRTALTTMALPVGILLIGLFLGPQRLTLSTFPPVLAIMALPCAVGYLAARADDDGAEE